MGLPKIVRRTKQPRREDTGFTLVEMLAVMAIVLLLLGSILPSLVSLKGSQDVTQAAYNLRGVLETARSYATANNTYVWVGFCEQDYGTTGAPAAPSPPPYSGIGHVTAAIVYSIDGTKLVDDASTASTPLPPASIRMVGRLTQIYGIHLTALPAPSAANTTDTLSGRPYQPASISNDSAALARTQINSDSADTTLRPFTIQKYTFYKTIRYNPRGEANVDSTYPCTRIIEVGLQPTHGNTTDRTFKTTPNLVAIQQAGVGGAVNIYRP